MATDAATATEKPRKQRKKPVRTAPKKKEYPVPDGGFTELTQTDDWNGAIHTPLKKENFSDSLIYYDWKIRVTKAALTELEGTRAKLAAVGDADARAILEAVISKSLDAAKTAKGAKSKINAATIMEAVQEAFKDTLEG